MPLLYGEGAVKAFRSLQENIIARSSDETIFPWTTEGSGLRGMLALIPAEFAESGTVRRLAVTVPRPPSVAATYSLEFSTATGNRSALELIRRDWFCCSLATSMRAPIASILLEGQSRKHLPVELWRPTTEDSLWRRKPSASHHTQLLLPSFPPPILMCDFYSKINVASQGPDRDDAAYDNNDWRPSVALHINMMLRLAVLATVLLTIIVAEDSTSGLGLASVCIALGASLNWMWYHFKESLVSVWVPAVTLLIVRSRYMLIVFMLMCSCVSTWQILLTYRHANRTRHSNDSLGV